MKALEDNKSALKRSSTRVAPTVMQERGVKRFLSVTATTLECDNFRGMKEAAWGSGWNDGRTYYQTAMICHVDRVTRILPYLGK